MTEIVSGLEIKVEAVVNHVAPCTPDCKTCYPKDDEK